MNRKNVFKKAVVIYIVVSLLGLTSSLSAGRGSKNNLSSFPYTGNILYVGGNGPNNYSSIQDAISDASNGDTVFVYAESSPYNENVVVEKSITLTGEDRDTVIIDGGGTGRVVSVEASDVTISKFTIQNSGNTWYHDAGVGFGTWSSPIYNRITIKENKMINNYDGIYAYYGENHVFSDNILTNNRHAGIYLHSGCEKSIVSSNTATYDEDFGIYCQNVEENEIFDNTVTNNEFGIFMLDSISDTVHNNIIKDNTHGFTILDTWDGNIYRNQIENSEEGMYCGHAPRTNIKENNFVNNDLHARFSYPGGILSRALKPTWKNNYWQGHIGIFPRIIHGKKWFEFFNPFAPNDPITFEFSWFDIDFNPAKKPFDI